MTSFDPSLNAAAFGSFPEIDEPKKLSSAELFERMLDQPVSSVTVSKNSVNASTSVLKRQYNELVRHRNVLTHSISEKLTACPRKYQHLRMSAQTRQNFDHESAVLAFGHAVGAGVAAYDESRDLDAAIAACFLSWNIDIFAHDNPKRGIPTRSFAHAIEALLRYAEFYESELGLDEYELVIAEGVVTVNLENGYFYTGHVDEIYRHKVLGSYAIKENKTTGAMVDPLSYEFSEQTAGYSTVIATLGAMEYTVLYTVYSASDFTWHRLAFNKGLIQRVEWLKTQLFRCHELDMYTDDDYFPRRNSGCKAYGRACEYAERCQMSPQQIYGIKFTDLPRVNHITELDAIEASTIYVTLTELLANMKETAHAITL